jgi:hypothetical protein
MRRRPRKNNAQQELGRQWAEKHFLMPGRPEPLRYSNLDHDKACAERWNELTGRFPSWWTHIVHRLDGWWIINAEGAACDCGPYDEYEDAEHDALGMANFAQYHDKPGYVTSEKKRKNKPSVSQKPANAPGSRRRPKKKYGQRRM